MVDAKKIRLSLSRRVALLGLVAIAPLGGHAEARAQVAPPPGFDGFVERVMERFAYDNVLYPVAGEVIAAVSGMSWEDFVSSRILEPAGMELAPLRHDFQFYALGLGVRDYRGRRMLTHTGGLPGYLSQVAFMPGDRLGVVVLTNQESGEAFNAITYHVLDHYLAAPAWDWLAGFGVVKERNDAALAAFEARTTAERNEESTPSLPLAPRSTPETRGPLI